MTLTGVIPRVSRDAWAYQTIQDRCSTTEPERQGPPQLACAKPERQGPPQLACAKPERQGASPARLRETREAKASGGGRTHDLPLTSNRTGLLVEGGRDIHFATEAVGWSPAYPKVEGVFQF